MPYQLSVNIYNSAGEVVRHLFSGSSQNQSGGFSLGSTVVAPGGPGVSINFGGILQGGSDSLVWQGSNDNGQPVSGGTYYIKVDEIDPFGSVQSWTSPVAVLPPVAQQSLNIYNSAGELVAHLDLSSLPPGTTLTDLGFADPSKTTFALPSDPSGPGGVDFKLKESNSSGTASADEVWNGRNSQGQEVASGSYIVQLVSEGAGGQSIISSKGFIVLATPQTLSIAKVIAVPNPLGPTDKSLVLVTGSLPSGAGATAKLYNIAGELVAQGAEAAGGGRIVLTVGNWSSGIYIVMVEIRQSGDLLSRQILRIAIQR
jgi:hypothetical protein